MADERVLGKSTHAGSLGRRVREARSRAAGGGPRLVNVTDAWLTIPDVAEALEVRVTAVHRLLEDRSLVAVRRGPNAVLSVPAAMLMPGRDGTTVVPTLPGTVQLLVDAGLTDEEIVAWLTTPDASLTWQVGSNRRSGSPLDALRDGHKGEVRRRAQAFAT